MIKWIWLLLIRVHQPSTISWLSNFGFLGRADMLIQNPGIIMVVLHLGFASHHEQLTGDWTKHTSVCVSLLYYMALRKIFLNIIDRW